MHKNKKLNYFSVYLTNYRWWVTGGRGAKGATSSTELFDFSPANNAEKGQNVIGLPMAMYGHCMVYKDSAVFVTGGYHGRVEENSGISSDVWIYKNTEKIGVDDDNVDITLLNSLNIPRMRHSCGNYGNKIVIAGGFDGMNSVDSVEILDLTNGEFAQWEILEEKLPFPLHGASMINLMGNYVPEELHLFGGKTIGRKGSLSNHMVYNGTWSISDTKLSVPRSDFALIPHYDY